MWVVTCIVVLRKLFGCLTYFDDDGPGSCLNVSRNVHGDPPETVLVGLANFDDLGPGSSLNVGCDAHRVHLLGERFPKAQPFIGWPVSGEQFRGRAGGRL